MENVAQTATPASKQRLIQCIPSVYISVTPLQFYMAVSDTKDNLKRGYHSL